MPQFDTFIFSSSLFYFICFFLIILIINFVKILPRLAAIIKIRSKITASLENEPRFLYVLDPYTYFSCSIPTDIEESD